MQQTERPPAGRRVVHWMALLALCGAGLGGCPSTDTCPSANLILISIDTLRADHVGAYGYPRATSPFLDDLARRGVLFENAYSPAPWTLPAHASMFSGLYPHRHGISVSGSDLPEDVEMLAEVLRHNGYATAGISNMIYVDRLRRGFDYWKSVPPSRAAGGSLPRISSVALDWLEEHREGQDDGPFFLFLHVYDVHTAYLPEDRYRKMFAGEYDGRANGFEKVLKAHRLGRRRLDERDAQHLMDLYDAEIRQTDAGLRRLFVLLESVGALEDTVVVVTSDHGEEFLDHGDFLHGRTLYEELVRVPWILLGRCVPSGLRVASPVSLVDLMPTVLGVLGIAPPSGLDGIDARDLWRGRGTREERTLLFETDEWHAMRTGDRKRALLARGRKIHADAASGTFELYDLSSDPAEKENLADTRDIPADERRRLEDLLRQGPTRESVEALPPKSIEQLRMLGYVD